MPQYAENKDLYDIQELFNECFPEDINFNKWFFENKLKIEDTVVYKINESIAGMLIRMPQVIEGVGKATYIYGACTRKEYRRLGVMSKLLEFSHNEDMRQGIICSMLIPAEEWLFEFYAQYGYRVSGYLKSTVFNAGINGDICKLRSIEETDINTINNIYRCRLSGEGYVVRGKDYWSNLLDLFNKLNGEALLMSEKDNVLGYALLWKGREPYIQELCCLNEEYSEKLINSILKRLGVSSIKVTQIVRKRNKPFVMAKWYDMGKSAGFYANMLWN